MGLIALLFSIVIEAIWPLSGRPALDDAALDDVTDAATDAAPARVLHPMAPYAQRLIDWFSGDDAASTLPETERYLSAPGWLAVLAVPAVLIAVAEAILGAVSGFLVFAFHVAVLYLTIGLGAFHRRFSELQLLIGAGEEHSARNMLARWVGAASAAAAPEQFPGRNAVEVEETDASQPVAALASGQVVLSAYRDVFAPLFWYVVLPGAIGPVLYLFARFAACRCSGFARTGYRWLDWLPLRLAALNFALVGQFEETIFCLRGVSRLGIERDWSDDPFLHQRLLLLPVAGGALGLRLTDAVVDAHLRTQAPDLDLPGADAQPSLRPVAGLLHRSAAVWLVLYLLVKLLV